MIRSIKKLKNRSIKIIRKLLQNITIFCFHIVLFKLKDALVNLAKIIGILKYIKCEGKFNLKKFFATTLNIFSSLKLNQNK